MFDGPTKETHLIYLIDKRKSQIEKREKKIKELKKVIDNASDDMLLTSEKESLDKNLAKVESLKNDITDYEAQLKEFRENYYGDKKEKEEKTTEE